MSAVRPASKAQILGRGVAAVSVAALVLVVAMARSSGLLVAIVVLVATAWGMFPQAVDAFFGVARVPDIPPGSTGSITVVVHLEGQPSQSALPIVTAAMAAGPAVIVTTDEHAAGLLASWPATVISAPSVEVAINRAASVAETDALMIVSAFSFVDRHVARRAAGLIRDGAAWVVARSAPFNRDGYAPLVRDRFHTRIRASARRGGLTIWEPNAVVLSTQMVRDHPFEPGVPWGHLLRAWSATGGRGVELRETVSMVAEPVDARSYWATSVARRRREVADLADAALTTGWRERCLALGLLTRELNGCQLILWLLVPWLSTRSEPSAPKAAWAIVVLTVLPGALRWVAERRVHAVAPHPLDDTLARAFDAPASVLALPALARRAAPTRVRLPGQPLAFAAVVFAAFSVVPLFSEGTAASRSAAVGLAITELAALWLVMMRVVFQHSWRRKVYRSQARLGLHVDDVPATTIDVSPYGLSCTGDLDRVPTGTAVSLDIALDNGAHVAADGSIANHRRRGATEVTGVALDVVPADQSKWVAQLFRLASRSSGGPLHTRQSIPTVSAARPLPVRAVQWTLAVVIGLASAATLLALCLAIAGYRPLIVRSGSMEPAIMKGDVVIVEDVQARQLAPGDVATIRDPTDPSGTITHRVRAVALDKGVLVVTTRGDANTDDETFRMDPAQIVGRVAARWPRLGNLVVWAGSSTNRAAAAIGGAVLAAGLVMRARRASAASRSRGAPPAAAVGRPRRIDAPTGS